MCYKSTCFTVGVNLVGLFTDYHVTTVFQFNRYFPRSVIFPVTSTTSHRNPMRIISWYFPLIVIKSILFLCEGVVGLSHSRKKRKISIDLETVVLVFYWLLEATWPFRRAHRFIIIFDLILGKTSFLFHFRIACSCLNGSAISNFP